MIKGLFLVFLIFSFMDAAEERVSSSTLIKQKIEIKELKKELNRFYNKKEEEYQKRKKELDEILLKVEKEKRDIAKIQENNLDILRDIKGEVETKTAKIYNKMKPKVAASIFNQMITDGKIEDVFAIILKIKEIKVTALMKFLSPKNAAQITKMLQDFNVDNQIKG